MPLRTAAPRSATAELLERPCIQGPNDVITVAEYDKRRTTPEIQPIWMIRAPQVHELEPGDGWGSIIDQEA